MFLASMFMCYKANVLCYKLILLEKNVVTTLVSAVIFVFPYILCIYISDLQNYWVSGLHLSSRILNNREVILL
jgi:hypothetical protein